MSLSEKAYTCMVSCMVCMISLFQNVARNLRIRCRCIDLRTSSYATISLYADVVWCPSLLRYGTCLNDGRPSGMARTSVWMSCRLVWAPSPIGSARSSPWHTGPADSPVSTRLGAARGSWVYVYAAGRGRRPVIGGGAGARVTEIP